MFQRQSARASSKPIRAKPFWKSTHAVGVVPDRIVSIAETTQPASYSQESPIAVGYRYDWACIVFGQLDFGPETDCVRVTALLPIFEKNCPSIATDVIAAAISTYQSLIVPCR